MGLAVALTAFGVAVMLLAEWRAWPRTARVAKPLASAGFLLAAVGVGALDSTYGRILLAGLVASWVGDVALMSGRNRWFFVGLVSFAAAHVAYAVAFASRGIDPWWTGITAVALIGPAWVVFRWMRPHLPDTLVLPVQVYVVLICTMVAIAAGTHGHSASPALIGGAVGFFLSDLSVARDKFVQPGLWNRVWGWPLYYAAQLLLASTAAGA
jgi:uncharacterized membrane protein YhhN